MEGEKEGEEEAEEEEEEEEEEDEVEEEEEEEGKGEYVNRRFEEFLPGPTTRLRRSCGCTRGPWRRRSLQKLLR